MGYVVLVHAQQGNGCTSLESTMSVQDVRRLRAVLAKLTPKGGDISWGEGDTYNNVLDGTELELVGRIVPYSSCVVTSIKLIKIMEELL